MMSRENHGWQLVLADLSLILFLVTLTALVNTSSESTASVTRAPYVAPAQALFRPTLRGPSLPEWLAEQPRDPRSTLTIIAQHRGEDQDVMWQDAQLMAASVAHSDVAVRVVITKGKESDLYASLAYDEPDSQ
ncbi:hypothetical protein [uncultured Erythrobacter sp.]|uniref:hypothetical protein n=1 Tax=uncultured Erythrobacter sp. TaxID=263913 RepID=UPI002603B3BA|nr:hypothetical protein [uncultured Erythrobacter sp.]